MKQYTGMLLLLLVAGTVLASLLYQVPVECCFCEDQVASEPWLLRKMNGDREYCHPACFWEHNPAPTPDPGTNPGSGR